MKSMTGYGESKVATTAGVVEVALRSVNGRFLDFKFQLAPSLAVIEKEVRDIIGEVIHRGTLTVSISRKSKAEKSVRVRTDRAKQVYQDLKKLSKDLRLKNDVTLSDLLSFSHLLTGDENTDAITEADRKKILKAVLESLKKLETEKTREGQRLQKDIMMRLQKISSLVSKVTSLRLQSQSEISERLNKKVIDLKLKDFDSERMAQEIVWAIEKSDIQEEITRLEEHLRHMRKLVESKDGTGKKLDFYTQELLREINTIGSKANHSGITEAVVEIKTLIDQIKEQVQNVE
jgi:uncharacterized protein (TIGR00255 family)